MWRRPGPGTSLSWRATRSVSTRRWPKCGNFWTWARPSPSRSSGRGPIPPRVKDVGVLKDLGSHDIDLLHHMTGSRFRTVSAVASTNIGEHEDTALIIARMENGILGEISTNWVTPYRSREMRVATKTRYFRADLITQQVTEYSQFVRRAANYSVRECFVAYREPIREELTLFLAALREGAPVPVSGEDGLYVLEVIERIEKGLQVAEANNA